MEESRKMWKDLPMEQDSVEEDFMDRPGSSSAVRRPQGPMEVDYDVDAFSTKWILLGKSNVRALANSTRTKVPNPNMDFPCAYLHVIGHAVEDLFKQALETAYTVCVSLQVPV